MSSDDHKEKLSPEVRAWANKQYSDEEIIAGLREIEQTGGLELQQFLAELEKLAGANG